MLMRAAMSSPTAMDKRPWAFVAVDNKEMLNKLAGVCDVTMVV